MIEQRNAKVHAQTGRRNWDVETPRDLVSPLDLAGGLRAPVLSDEELDELCTIEIGALSRLRTNENAD